MSTRESKVRFLYQEWLSRWNARDASGLGTLCTTEAMIVGFDGSQMEGKAAVTDSLGGIFAHHETARYIGLVRGIRFLSPTVAVLTAVAGMVPRQKDEINPAVNAVQTMVATESDNGWLISIFQNTPAAFHGRPHLAEQLTAELQDALRKHPFAS